MADPMRWGLARAVLGLAAASTAALGQQVIERDTRLTGPRGRTIERDVRVERGPGYVDRRIEIKRPGETLIRDTRASTGPGGRPWGPGGGGPRFHGGPPIIEEVIVQRPPVFSTFVGVPFFNLFVGSAPPPPVVVYPEPVFVPPPVVVYPPPQPVAPPPQVAVDPLADALGRLKSHHGNSRRDGALTLGRIGDDRAVPALIDRLDKDTDKEARVAAAWALGEIADERAALPLERASLHDRKHEVREAASIAYRKLPKPGQVPTSAPPSTPIQPQGAVIRSRPAEVLDPGPNSPVRINPDDMPPPPPTPDPGPALEGPNNPPPFRNPS